MRCKANVKIIGQEGENILGFGRGIVSLLEGVDRFGSINRATQDMGMAYSKAWKIIKTTEKEMGIKLLDRAEGNTSVLTTAARELLSIYNEMHEAAQQAAEEVFRQRTIEAKELKIY